MIKNPRSAELLTILALAATACSNAGPDINDYATGNVIWFDTPTSSEVSQPWLINDFSATITNPDPEWERNSLPIGNGSFGGAVLGSVARERVVLNEKTLWMGGPATGTEEYWDMNRTVDPATLDTIRQLLVDGKNREAGRLTSERFRGNINYDRSRFGTFTVMGEALVNTGIDEAGITDYKRVLNLDKSLAVVTFADGPATYTRRYFCSYPDSVMVWNYESEGAMQNLTFEFVTPHKVTSITDDGAGSLLYQGVLENNGMRWALRVMARVNGNGTVTTDAEAGTISVADANNVDFLLAGDTDYVMNFDPDPKDAKAFVGADPALTVNAVIDAAAKKSFRQLYAAHYADYSELYDRVKLSINPDKHSNDTLTTPARLKAYREGAADPGLEETYFQFGRYLLISSSRPGTMPANLQGLWHNNFDGPWHMDYHNNINLQMNYWPASVTNLDECFVPFVDYVRGIIKPGERTADAYYGARGWTAAISTNVFGFTAPLNSEDMTWNYNPSAGPWLATQIWDYYDYTRDTDWLRNVGYDIIKGSANFASDLLYKVNGSYTAAPSYSPEHGDCDLGATYANAVTREVLLDAIEAARVLDVDADLAAEWQARLDSIYPYQIGQYGQLQEWYNDIDPYGDQHRHTNHLFGLHPGHTIDAVTDTVLANACKETLRQRGDEATGWSMGWKLNHWARLLDGDHAYTLYRNLLSHGTADNLWDMHPPFQIDGNFGGTAGVAELFLQSQNKRIHLLPALPSTWTDCAVTGLRARGNFEVDVYVKDGALDYAEITSLSGGPCHLLYRGHELDADTKPGEKLKVTADAATGELSATSL